jgi:uncharacterized protein YdeI (BOF family)
MRKKMKKWILVLMCISLLSIAAACTQASAAPVAKPATPAATPAANTQAPSAPANTAAPQTTGAASETDNALKTARVGDILKNAKLYDGKTVIVEGKIISECGSGCWFTLKDSTATIYIDLAPNNMVIPQKKGATARVTAKVVNEGSDVYLIGSKVEF